MFHNTKTLTHQKPLDCVTSDKVNVSVSWKNLLLDFVLCFARCRMWWVIAINKLNLNVNSSALELLQIFIKLASPFIHKIGIIL